MTFTSMARLHRLRRHNTESAISFLSNNPNAFASPLGMIRIYKYTPTEGEHGVPITVHMDFHHPQDKPVYVRIVVGNKALATQVRLLKDATDGHWQLEASAPPFDHSQFSSAEVPITVQALSSHDRIIDSVTFGSFKYWESDTPYPAASSCEKNSSEEPQLSMTAPAPILAPSAPAPSASVPPPVRLPRSRDGKSPRAFHRKKRDYLMRRKKPDGYSWVQNIHEQPELKIVTPFERLARGWDETEFSIGRRLVRFWKEQQGAKLFVSCERILPEEYREEDIVISCIYRGETDTCVVTSADIIYLLENLVDWEFEVEEKNRIRRNLEGLKPTTISKDSAESQEFYHRIMDFPDPQPRKIEKKMKVFEWKVLGLALDKIISKYSLYTEESDGDSSDPPSTVSNSPIDFARDGQVLHKGESGIADAMHFMPVSNGIVPEYPTAQAKSAVVPTSLFVSMDISSSKESSSGMGGYAPDLTTFNPSATYDVSPVEPQSDSRQLEVDYGLNTFDSREFQALREAATSDYMF